MESDFSKYIPTAQHFVDFVNDSPTAFHAVDSAKKKLALAGFKQISEKDQWHLEKNGKYYYTRNQSTIVAFVVGGKYEPGNGLTLIGAHTDSPHLNVKPNPEVKSDYVQIEIEPYGGGLWTTWFDRDLTIAGRVIVKKEHTYETMLVRIERPILRIPTLAIHLDRDSGAKLEFNKQSHLFPILASAVKSELEKKTESKVPLLFKMVADELKVPVEDIKEYEISVVDTQKATIGGAFNEWIFSPRLDNLNMSFCSLTALIEASKDQAIANEKNVIGVALFDHEEVGSESAHGAASPIVSELVKRITHSEEKLEIALRKSFFVSADMAHGVHPNYRDKHDPNHKPAIHGGVVIKQNGNQRYATNSVSALPLREIAKRHNIPIQDFVVRNDSACGSTIGPIISAQTGIRTVDVGNPQLSMHSIRETCGVSDLTHAITLFKAFFLEFTALDEQLRVD